MNQIKEKKTRIKSYRTIWIFILIVIFIVGSLPFIIWNIKPTNSLNALIIDKTVPDNSYREHKGLMWIINNNKFINSKSGQAFKYNDDYYGFFPLPKEKYDIHKLPDKFNSKIDLVYLTDTYGVYSNEFYSKNLQGERSKIIYGGTEESEIKTIKENIKNATIIAEFNTIASPTQDNVRNEMESYFGIKWSGWIGRYFSDLSKNNPELPLWLIRNYESRYNKLWTFTGPGFAFVKSDDTCFILQSGVDLGKSLNRIVFSDNFLGELNVKNNVKYYYWFEIVEASKESDIIAKYTLDTNESGNKILKEFGLNNSFPAIIKTKGINTTYYFAGDFADNKDIPSLWNLCGLYYLNKISTIDIDGDQQYFYWNVYYPLMEKILSDINIVNKVIPKK